MQKINVRNLLRMQKDGYSIRPLHIILGNKSLEKLGEIVNIPADTITYHPQFNSYDELSFTVYKNRNNEEERLWKDIVDFKLVYVKEYDEWFEITVNVNESEVNTKKVITAKSLCEAELSQITFLSSTKDFPQAAKCRNREARSPLGGSHSPTVSSSPNKFPLPTLPTNG